jgi:hypothetical protein
MADLPFPGYDTMSDTEVRREIAQRFFDALDPHRKLVETALAFEDAEHPHPELIKKLRKELKLLDEQVDEGTQRWGGLDNG